VPFISTLAEDGLTNTAVRAGGGVEVMVIVAELVAVLPLSVAVTVKVTEPALGPAVKVVLDPVWLFTLPSVLLKNHE
jgi:hypothetical protein